MSRNSLSITHKLYNKAGLLIPVLLIASSAIFLTIGIQSQDFRLPVLGAVVTGLSGIILWLAQSSLSRKITVIQDALGKLVAGDGAIELPTMTGKDNVSTIFTILGELRDMEEDKKLIQMDFSGQVKAIAKSQAVIEFNMDGTIITANDLFLNASGYTLSEIKGRHHSMFVEPAFKETVEYRDFWDKLKRGEYEAKEYKRLGKAGKEIWVQASYNPILDRNGKPFKVLEYATDITDQKLQSTINQYIKTATDGVTTNIMMIDTDYNLVYLNQAMQDMLKAKSEVLRKSLPNLNVNNIKRDNIDVFNNNPADMRKILDNLTGITETFLDMDGIEFSLVMSAIRNEKGERKNTVIVWEDITENRVNERERTRISAENQRIKMALDSASTNVMVADKDFNIVYMNQTMKDMMKRNEAQLKVELPRLDANNLIGVNIDIFHKNPAHQRKILNEISGLTKANIAVSGLDFDLVVNPVMDDNGKRTGTVVEWEDVTEKLAREKEENRVTTENQRIKIALDNARTNVMVADKDLNIVYMNDIMRKMMQDAEADLRKELPNFNASKLIGTNIDIFHKNPAHQRGMLANLTKTIETNIKVGAFDFNLIVNPVSDDNGERLGTVVEWKDMTQELAIEVEIAEVVDAAAAGDFTKRVGVSDKQGFMLNLANSINTIGVNTQAATDDLARVLSELAKGNLTEKIVADYEGTFDVLKSSSNETADQLMKIVMQVNQSAAEVASASGELSIGSDDLSRRTEAQASALEETAASMEELAVTVKQNADNANDANKLADKSREMAVDGGEVAKEAVAAMGTIEKSSQQVSDIIGVIDDLAFQTNLLALNAAVEAARAGEAGKGFAVVAEEVRTLAQRSAQASNEIKALITSSNTQVKNGVELVNNAGKALNDIMDSISKVADIVADIASASSEQAQGIDEVNVAIAEMDDMTQQNSSLVEESTASARVLERQAGEMQRLMSFFNVGDNMESQSSETASPVLLQQEQVRRALKAEPRKAIVKPSLKKVAGKGGASRQNSDWSEF